MQVKVYNQDAKETGAQVELPSSVFGREQVNSAVVHFVATAARANARHPIAKAKTRGEVRGGGKKPWQQKGTGRARAGSIRSPLWKGGGVIFGPRPNRNFSKKVNKKVKRLGLASVLSDRARENRLVVLENLASTGKTRELSAVLEKFAAALSGRKFLILSSGQDINLARAARNLPNVKVNRAANLNILDLLTADTIVILKDALPVMEKIYGTAK